MKLENPFGCEVNYEWVMPANCPFTVEPTKNTIKPHANSIANFVYSFETGGDPGLKL